MAELAGDRGQRFLLGGPEVLRACLACDATFPQTDDGWEALKQHGFDEHEFIKHYDWTELDGMEVTIAVVRRADEPNILDPSGLQTELIARAKDGTVYFLPFSHYDRGDAGGFKCKPKSRGNNLLRLTQHAAALPSNG